MQIIIYHEDSHSFYNSFHIKLLKLHISNIIPCAILKIQSLNTAGWSKVCVPPGVPNWSVSHWLSWHYNLGSSCCHDITCRRVQSNKKGVSFRFTSSLKQMCTHTPSTSPSPHTSNCQKQLGVPGPDLFSCLKYLPILSLHNSIWQPGVALLV